MVSFVVMVTKRPFCQLYPFLFCTRSVDNDVGDNEIESLATASGSNKSRRSSHNVADSRCVYGFFFCFFSFNLKREEMS